MLPSVVNYAFKPSTVATAPITYSQIGTASRRAHLIALWSVGGVAAGLSRSVAEPALVQPIIWRGIDEAT